MAEIWMLRGLVLLGAGAFLWQVGRRVALVRRAKNDLTSTRVSARLGRVFLDVLCQRKTIAAKPLVGLAHACVFWGFTAFAGYTTVEFLRSLGLADWTAAGWFLWYERLLIPFALAVLVGMAGLLVRRTVVRPRSLSVDGSLSVESVVIGVAIVTLMVTFLLDLRLEDERLTQINWWVHALVVLGFLVLIPGSKHLHLVVSPFTLFLKSERLGTLRDLDFEREEVGLETVADLERKQVIDAFTCVECGRCQDRCPAFSTGKLLNPKTLVLQNEAALLAGTMDRKLGDLYDPGVLWQCTTCGACEDVCPVGVEHLPLLIGARRGLTSNGEAPDALGAVYNHLDRRGNIWGLGTDQRRRFVESAEVETFDADRHDYLVWLGCAGNFEAEYQRSLRALFAILRRKEVSFGVLAQERCTGDPARRTGNELAFQELAGWNTAQLAAARARTIVTSCPHCVHTLGRDYGDDLKARVVHSSVLLEELTRDEAVQPAGGTVVFHDPCYLARYGAEVKAPRAVLERMGARLTEAERSGRDTFCCGAGGGLLFDDGEEPGTRISDDRFRQLTATGADTIVMGCPFCSIMLRGAQASSHASVQLVDLATYVEGKLAPAPASRHDSGPEGTRSPASGGSSGSGSDGP